MNFNACILFARLPFADRASQEKEMYTESFAATTPASWIFWDQLLLTLTRQDT